jgi:hypothetical protein
MDKPPKEKGFWSRFGDSAFDCVVVAVLTAAFGSLIGILHWSSPFPIATQIASWALVVAAVVLSINGFLRLHDWWWDRKHNLEFVLDERLPYHLQDTAAVHMYRIGVKAHGSRVSLTGLQVRTYRFSAVQDSIETRTALAKFQNAPLMIGDDREHPPRKSCDLHPGVTGFFEFVTQVKDRPWGKTKFHFCHAMDIEPFDPGRHSERKRLYEGAVVRVPTDDVPLVDCVVTLVASAENIPAKYQDFRISIRDGSIHLAMIGPPRGVPSQSESSPSINRRRVLSSPQSGLTPTNRLSDVRLTIKGQSVSIAETASRSDAILWRDATAEILADNCQASVAAEFLKITEDISQKEKPFRRAIAAAKQHLIELSQSIPAEYVFLAATKERIVIEGQPNCSGDDWYICVWNRSALPVAIAAHLIAAKPLLTDRIRLPLPLRFGGTPEKEMAVEPKGSHAMVMVCCFAPSKATNGICTRGDFDSYVQIPKENYELTIRAVTQNGASDSRKFRMINAASHGALVMDGSAN